MFQRCTQIVRLLHRTCPHMVKRKPTPGAGRQLKVLESAEEFIADPEGFGDFESDFMRLDKTHRQHEAEQQVQREQVRHMIVKRKYFKEQKLPALLLYAEKNEIRTLHARDPEEWTIEKLAESFPATPDTIKKIIKSNWRPYSMKSIRRHDEAVIRNWENLKNGNLADGVHIPAELREHLLKFAKRTLQNTAASSDDSKTAALLLPKLPKPDGNEFSSIITSCKKYANTTETNVKLQHREKTHNQQATPNIDPSDETYLIDKICDKRKMRLQEFQKFKLPKFEQMSNAEMTASASSEADVIISLQENNNPSTGFIQKFASNEIVVSEEDSKKYEMTPYKEQIHIPRKLWRKGGTYRVYDCYYDDDGEFLYRVPGMSGPKKTQ